MKRCMGCMELIEDGLRFCPNCGFNFVDSGEDLDALQSGSRLINRYIIGKPLGRGGFGITYIAWDENLHRKVAIKEYMPRGLASREPGTSTVISTASNQTESFEKGINKTTEESRKLAGASQLSSVVTVFDCFKENGTAYIVMELLEGQNLKQYIQTKGVLNYDDALKIITPVLQTLSVLHKNGLIHRDISPDNIFLCNDGKVKLLDFGAARVIEYGSEYSRTIEVKHGYAPIEQFSSRGNQGPYTDVYAVAATMYKILTGITPEDSIERITGEDELRNIAELTYVPYEAAVAIMKGLELKEKDRIQTADEFLKKLTVNKNQYQANNNISALEKEKSSNASDETDSHSNEDELNSEVLEDEKTVILDKNLLAGTDSNNNSGDITPEEQIESETEDDKIISKKKIMALTAVLVSLTIVGSIASYKRNATESVSENLFAFSEISDFSGANVDDEIIFGHYEQDNNTSNGKEDIEWRVLAKENNRILVISKYALDCKPYNKSTSDSDVTWESCSLRKWLNDTFFNAAFSTAEQANILSTSVPADENPDYSTNPGNATNDKVFLLSRKEAEKYFESAEDRKCESTEYAIAQGVWVYSVDWWLRTPGTNSINACYVSDGGLVDYSGHSVLISDDGVRPALWIKI